MGELPEDLIVPQPFVGHSPDLDARQPLRIWIQRKSTYCESPSGTRRLDSIKDLVRELRAKHSFTITPQGELDSVLKHLSRDSLFTLDVGLPVDADGWELDYRGTSLKFKKGREVRYIWNLWRFFRLEKAPVDLNSLDALIELLIHHLHKNKISFSTLASPSAVARHLLVRYAYQEFITGRMDYEVTNDIYQACHGGRSESMGIGTTQAWNYDMQTAHLQIMSELPSVRGCQHRKDWPYIEEANYGVYLIEAEVPNDKMCPLPIELPSQTAVNVVWPYGTVTGWYAKPFLDLLTKLGLKFKVLKSHQYVPYHDIPKPFKNMTTLIRGFIRNAPPYINAKGLYYGMAGSTISWRWIVADATTGEYIPRAFSVFAPLIYSHVLATQSVKVWKEASRGEPLAIRSDAITMRQKIWTPLKFEDSGTMTFVTPLIKSFPSGRGEDWRGLILERPDAGSLWYQVEDYPTIFQVLRTGAKLGRLWSRSVQVIPSHGFREGVVPNRVGALLDSWYTSKAPSIDKFKL